MKKLALHWQILIAVVLGTIYGISLPGHIRFIEWMGTVFIRLLFMLVAPLVLSSLVTGITGIETGARLGRLGIKTFFYYMVTSLLAILTGLFFVNLFKPGFGMDALLDETMQNLQVETKPLSETLLDIVPSNFFQTFIEGNMLSVIFIAFLIGIFINRINSDHANILRGFFSAFFELIMKITMFVIRLAPIGIFSLVATEVAINADLDLLAVSLGKYMLTVITGLAFHFLVTLPLILLFVARVNPVHHFRAMITPLITAFSTASSNATLPVTMEAVEDNAGVSNQISSFTLPLGATINMDGTALYELVVVGFVAQLYGIDLSFAQQFIIVTTALLSSIGTAGVPMASLVTMTIIFSAVGLPFEAVALVLPVDRPLDMLRTATNVFSDSCGAVTIASTEKELLKI